VRWQAIIVTVISEWFCCSTIARPFDGRVTKGRALIMLIFVWAYTLPWAIMPMLDIWGRFVPGEVSKAVIRKISHKKNGRKVENGQLTVRIVCFVEV
jgi:predicted DNA repair protein MutK